MYVNRTAAGNINDLAVGSVVILENYLRDQSLKTISVMYRTTGFNPDGNDWYWIEYNPDGSVAKDSEKQKPIRNVSLTASPKRMIMGKASNCIQCHQSAAGNDFVFSNDRFEQSAQVAQKEDLLPKVVAPKEEAPEQDSGDAFDLIADSDTDADTFFGSR